MERRCAVGLCALAVALLLSVGRATEAEGTVWASGYNAHGQLGLGHTENRTTPEEVALPVGVPVAALEAGSQHSLALASDGALWAWGHNGYGQLGIGDTVGRSAPLVVSALSGRTVTAVAAGAFHTLAVTSDGDLWAWGANGLGQLGLGDTVSRSSPTQVLALAGMDVSAVAAGGYFSLALTTDGRLWAWGANSGGQLGVGDTARRLTPHEVTFLENRTVIQIAAGFEHGLAVTSDGRLWAWGYNGEGELGLGDSAQRTSPTEVTALSGIAVSAPAAGYWHSFAVTSDGTLWAWGYNGQGELGLGDAADRIVPARVTAFSGMTVTAVAGGADHTLAATSDGRLWAWGGNGSGQLGLGSTSDQWTPSEVPFFSGRAAVALAAGNGHTIVLTMQRVSTSLWTIDRSGTITERVTLRAYDLKRTTDNLLLGGRPIAFKIDGTEVGSALTNAGGDANYVWTVTDGPASRSITAEFAGDAVYNGSRDDAVLTSVSWSTKMATFDRTVRIAARTELKARLLRSDNAPLAAKSIGFSVDGSIVIVRPTDSQGYARYPYYDVPDGSGAGPRTIQSEWQGNGGYAPVTKPATLTVLKALAYIWVIPRSVLHGGTAMLYGYFRRLPDYQNQVSKTVTFRVDGTRIADVVTGTSAEAGVARFAYQTVEPVGVHTIRCEFAGDPWVEAGHGEAALTVY